MLNFCSKIESLNQSILSRGFVVLLMLGSLACAPSTDPGTGIQVQVPWYQTQGNYALKWVELFSLRSFQPLQSTYVNIYQTPTVRNGRIRGTSPALRLARVGERKYVPSDMQSAELVAITAHFERLAEFDKKVGVFEVTRWPVDVGIAVKYMSREGEVETNNAIYEGNLDALLIVPYNRPEMPLSINGGVLAHEHFHAIFQRLVLNPISEKIAALKNLTVHKLEHLHEAFGIKPIDSQPQPADLNYQYHATLIRGINEGMADYWAWLYLEDSNFVKRSLSHEGRREVTAKTLQIWASNELRAKVEALPSDDFMMFRAYELGSIYAQNLRMITEVVAKQNGLSLAESKLLMAKTLIASLKNLSQQFNALTEQQMLIPFLPMKLVAEALPKNIKGGCEAVQAMLSNKEGMVMNCEANP